MHTYFTKTLLKTVYVLTASAILNTAAIASDAPEKVQIVDGMTIYIGVMPAEIIQGHPNEHPEKKMHGGVPKKGHRDHVVVALFDKDTGQRIEDATVHGILVEPGLRKQKKSLEPMKIAGTITYGNYFDMPDNSTYHIKIEVLRTDKPVIEAKFTHRHFEN
jgi:hypothetical protein